VTLLFYLAPSIYENDDIKKGILCQLFGGTNKDFSHAGRGKFRYNGMSILLDFCCNLFSKPMLIFDSAELILIFSCVAILVPANHNYYR
jgi:hypothetical protein